MSVNINQFAQTAIRGSLAMNIGASPAIITVQISANQATAMKAGDFVKFDTSSGNVPQALAASTSDVAEGVIIYDVKKAAPATGDYVQIALMNGSAVVYLTAASTISAGASVEDTGSSTVQTLAAAKMRGIALDPGTTGNLLRIIIRNATQS